MKQYNWDVAKNNILKKERSISFEDVLYYIEHDGLLAIVVHPDQDKYPGQKIYVINITDYVWLVPFIETEEEIFLKTIIPSRKATKKYLEKKDEKET